MLRSKLVSVVCVSMAMFACSPAEMPSRGVSDVVPAVATPANIRSGQGRVSAMVQNDYNIVNYTIEVPRSLLVSEADIYLPVADIVWHGDPQGDRHLQVQRMFSDAFERGTADMNSGRAVEVNVTVMKFHALTNKTRATFGGNYAMHFYLTVFDATTHEVIDGPRLVIADAKASGGVKALREEAEGLTQKVVVEARLAEVFHKELLRAMAPKAAPELVSRNAFSPSDLTLAE